MVIEFLLYSENFNKFKYTIDLSMIKYYNDNMSHIEKSFFEAASRDYRGVN